MTTTLTDTTRTDSFQPGTLEHHIQEVLSGRRRFETAAQAVTRMIIGTPGSVEKVTVCGQTTYDYKLFRQGKKPVVGMYHEINDLVNFVKDAAQGGSSRERGFIFVGEPGNGKTFFIETLCALYRDFTSLDGNRRFTFRFTGLDEALGYPQKLARIESQTYEDPMVLAMNLHDSRSANMELIASRGFTDTQVETIFDSYRGFGACTEYIIDRLRERYDGDVSKVMQHIVVVTVQISDSSGVLTGKYAPKDKITATAADLVGAEETIRLLLVPEPDNPYKLNVRKGALARVAGGGVHFVDEILKNKVDLVKIYLGVTQNRAIEIDGYKWPLDILVLATSNNDEYERFRAQRSEAPITDRFSVCFVSHNTDYRMQGQLTAYAIGGEVKTTVMGRRLHQDPNLNYAASVAAVLTRLPHDIPIAKDKMTPVEMLQLAAGEVAGDRNLQTLSEIVDVLSKEPDPTKRFGQKGIGQRGLGKAVQYLIAMSKTNEGHCMWAGDIFRALEQVVVDTVIEDADRAKYLADLKTAEELYKEKVMAELFVAYMDDPNAIKTDVMNYVNMVVGMSSATKDKTWSYKDPQTGELKAIKIDTTYIDAVESRLGLSTKDQKESYRGTIRRTHGQKVVTDPNYFFMDNLELVKAVTEVTLQSDVNGAGSLIGALANRTNERNRQLFNRMATVMTEQLGYCETCAEATMEYCIPKEKLN